MTKYTRPPNPETNLRLRGGQGSAESSGQSGPQNRARVLEAALFAIPALRPGRWHAGRAMTAHRVIQALSTARRAAVPAGKRRRIGLARRTADQGVGVPDAGPAGGDAERREKQSQNEEFPSEARHVGSPFRKGAGTGPHPFTRAWTEYPTASVSPQCRHQEKRSPPSSGSPRQHSQRLQPQPRAPLPQDHIERRTCREYARRYTNGDRHPHPSAASRGAGS